jgi:hypothetical protein
MSKGMRDMRLTTTIAVGLLAAGPLLPLCQPAHAQQNDLLGRAQQFLNNNNNDQSSRDAYERGREDQMRREQAQRDRNYRRDTDQRWGNRDLDRDGRYGGQDRETYNYNRYP